MMVVRVVNFISGSQDLFGKVLMSTTFLLQNEADITYIPPELCLPSLFLSASSDGDPGAWPGNLLDVINCLFC